MPGTLSERAAAVFRAALSGLLHELSSPLTVLRSDADFLAQRGGSDDAVGQEELAEIGAELDDVANRLTLLVDGFRGLPEAGASDQPLDSLLSSVLIVLRNELKYAWAVTAEIAPAATAPGSASMAWIAWAELVLLLGELFPEGGKLDIRSSERSILVAVEGSQKGRGIAAAELHGRLVEWIEASPYALRRMDSPDGGARGFALELVARNAIQSRA